MERPVLPSTKTPWFRYPEDLDPVLRDIRDNLDVLDSDVDDIQSGALPIALAGIEGALGAYEPLQNMRAGVFNVLDGGALGDGVTDDRVAIQAVEDAASAVGIALGCQVGVYFPPKLFAIAGSLAKKANTRWHGGGLIFRKDAAAPTGANFVLVKADTVDNWTIDGLMLSNLPLSVVQSESITSSFSGWALDGCILAVGCENFAIRNCVIEQYTYGIIHQGCRHYTISNNQMRAEYDPAKDRSDYQSDMLDDTYGTDYDNATTSLSGAIVVVYQGSGPPDANHDYLITGNQIENYGLNTGIDGLSQTYDQTPGTISNNVIEGGRSGVQCYRGSFSDPGTAPTWDAHVLINGNHISWIWEQGIYLRSSYGYLVDGNYLRKVALVGTNGVGSSAGGIVTRGDPSDAIYTSTISNPTPTIIQGNSLVDTGHPTTWVLDGGIQVRSESTIVRGNSISRSTLPTFAAGTADRAIMVQETILNFTVTQNSISGHHSGVQFDGTLVYGARRPQIPMTTWAISDNNLTDCAEYGIKVDARIPGGQIARNRLLRCGTLASRTAVSLRNAPYCEVSGNLVTDAVAGLTLASGHLASDLPRILSAGTATNAIRRGGTLIVRNNHFQECTTARVVSETDTPDTSFHGRCAVWEGDTVDGFPAYAAFSSTPSVANNGHTWNVGDIAPHSAPSSGTPFGWMCTVAGTSGTATTATGDTTNGSPVITNVSDLDGYGRGMYVTCTGFTGSRKILAIDTDNDTITVDTNAASSNVGVTLTVPTATFVALPNLA